MSRVSLHPIYSFLTAVHVVEPRATSQGYRCSLVPRVPYFLFELASTSVALGPPLRERPSEELLCKNGQSVRRKTSFLQCSNQFDSLVFQAVAAALWMSKKQN